MRTEVLWKDGDYVRAKWMEVQPMGTYSLTGCQNKVAAILREVTGTIVKICVDSITLQPDNGGPEITVKPYYIVKI